MIQVEFIFSESESIQSFSVSGHAESGPYGHDLVCSAVSALCISTENSLQKLAEIKPIVEVNDDEGGFLAIKLPQDSEGDSYKKSQLLLHHLYLGLNSIQKEYSQYLIITERTTL